METFRNNLTITLCTFLINHLAVGQFRDYIRVVYGMGVQRFDDEFWKLYHQRQEESEGV